MAKELWAQKGKMKKKFSDDAWDLLGENKNGWSEIRTVDQVVSSIKNVPDNGDKKNAEEIKVTSTAPQTVSNTADWKDAATNQVVENDLASKLNSTPEFSDFVKVNLSKSTIKDFFDSPEGNVAYKNNMTLDALAELLSLKFNNSIADLKSAFKIIDSVSNTVDSDGSL